MSLEHRPQYKYFLKSYNFSLIYFAAIKSQLKPKVCLSYSLARNKISSIPEKLFQMNPQLLTLTLTENKISYLHADIFSKYILHNTSHKMLH